MILVIFRSWFEQNLIRLYQSQLLLGHFLDVLLGLNIDPAFFQLCGPFLFIFHLAGQ